MFTGIIESTAKILKATDSGLRIERPTIFNDIKIGCSIAVSGVCLSVTSFDDSSMSFDVVPTTLQKSKLGRLRPGDAVNLERAMRADGRFEGHMVTGHCEGVGGVVSLVRAPTPGPSPWPSIAYAMSGKQGEGSAALSVYNRFKGRIWKGTSESKRPPHALVERARGMRREPTDAEQVLWKNLRGNQVNNIRFRRQHPIGLYIADFYSNELKLVIEIDGGIHDDPGLKEYELHRTGDLNSRGISVMRFSNEDVMCRLPDVLSAISSFGRAPLTRLADGERSEPEAPGEGSGVGAVKVSHSLGVDRPAQLFANNVEAANEKTGVFLTVRIPSSLLPYIVPHGSITIDGVALTVAEITNDCVTVALIPHTLTLTTFGALQEGQSVNIETDILGKYMLSRACSPVTHPSSAR